MLVPSRLKIVAAVAEFCVVVLIAETALAQFPAVFDLSTLDGTNGFVVNGINAGDRSGWSVSSAGDVNGDGIDDLIIGAEWAVRNGKGQAGESYVVYGSNAPYAAAFELSSLDGANGFTLKGNDPSDYSGGSVSGAGDFNGDGLADFIIGARGADPNGNRYAGKSYLVFGSQTPFGPSLELSSLSGTNGFVINGVNPNDFSGGSVSGAGDFNGDGIDDVIVGAELASPNGLTFAGESYVVYGSEAPFGRSLELSSLDGSNGFALSGYDTNSYSGSQVSGAGDFNGDGIDDLIIGARGAGPADHYLYGESYVVFGSASPFPASLRLSSLDGKNGFSLRGIRRDDRSGHSVSAAGDVNGDGIDDLIIGAFGADSNFTLDAGESYVIFGSTAPQAAIRSLSSLDGTNGFAISGIKASDVSGYSVSNAGDINGDGIGDLIIGAYQADRNGNANAGESYVVYGSKMPFTAKLNLSSLDGTNGFLLKGINASDSSGFSVSGAGDVNGDGIDDFIIGAHGVDSNGEESGASYVVFGRAVVPEPRSLVLLISSLFLVTCLPRHTAFFSTRPGGPCY